MAEWLGVQLAGGGWLGGGWSVALGFNVCYHWSPRMLGPVLGFVLLGVFLGVSPEWPVKKIKDSVQVSSIFFCFVFLFVFVLGPLYGAVCRWIYMSAKSFRKRHIPI